MRTNSATITCPRCGASVAAEYKFCPNCGFALNDARSPLEETPGASKSPESGRVPRDYGASVGPGSRAEDDEQATTAPFDAAAGDDADRSAADVLSRNPPDDEATTRPDEAAALNAPAEPERRQLTVMFCDLVGSVALSLELDPEDLRELVRRYQEVASTSIERFEGYVAQYLGDGILAYFGYPIAHEDEAERAVRAGREILAGIEQLGEAIREEFGVDLAVRIGVHTGVAVVGEVGSGANRENLALGEVPNIAARVQSLAAENRLVASEATYRLVARAFEGKDLGRHTLKGTDREERIFEIVDERTLGSPIELSGAFGEVSAVGRNEERAVFDRCWKDVENGRGRTLFVHGEPGIGKSHLVQLFRQSVFEHPHRCVDCRCSSYLQSTPLHPFVEWLRGVLNFYSGQTARDRLEVIEFVVARNEMTDPDAVALLASMLSVPLSDAQNTAGLAPSLRRERTEQMLTDLLLRLSEDEPLLMVVEDVHWADPSTRSFLERFAARTRDRRVLLVLTSRADPATTWSPDVQAEILTLRRLTHNEVVGVISEIADGRSIPTKLAEAIIDRADGVPLFVHELTRMAIETELAAECAECHRLGMDLPELAIPTTLHDSLMARLDRILPVKEVAQICSTIGREFTFELALAISGMDEVKLAAALDRLVEADLLHVAGSPQKGRYVFKHALLQEAAYASVLRGRRRLYHGRIAEYLIAHPDLEESRFEIIAYHLARAQHANRAAHYWRRAGEEAYERWANEEAAEYFTRGLAVLESAEATDDVRRDRFFLQAGLAAAAMQFRGYTHPSVLGAFEQALAIADELADETLAAPAIRGMWTHYTVIGDHRRAQDIAMRLAGLAERCDEPQLQLHADLALASTAFWRGQVVDAAAGFERILSTYGDTMDDLPRALLTQYPRVSALSYLSLARWYLGYPEEAERLGRASVAFATKIDHPFSVVFARGFHALLHTYLGRRGRVLQDAEKVLIGASRYGFPFWSGIGSVLKSWATCEADPERAIASIGRSVDALRQAGVQIWTSYPTVLMSDLMAAHGQVEEALDLAESVTDRAVENDEGYFLPELLRMRARFLLLAGRGDEARVMRRRALDLAQHQKARPILLRILLDMADDDAITPELNALLHTTFESFTEGTETAELVAARRMISA